MQLTAAVVDEECEWICFFTAVQVVLVPFVFENRGAFESVNLFSSSTVLCPVPPNPYIVIVVVVVVFVVVVFLWFL